MVVWDFVNDIASIYLFYFSFVCLDFVCANCTYKHDRQFEDFQNNQRWSLLVALTKEKSSVRPLFLLTPNVTFLMSNWMFEPVLTDIEKTSKTSEISLTINLYKNIFLPSPSSFTTDSICINRLLCPLFETI